MNTTEERDSGLEVHRQCGDCFAIYTRFRFPSVRFAEFGRCAACAAKVWARESARRARLLH